MMIPGGQQPNWVSETRTEGQFQRLGGGGPGVWSEERGKRESYQGGETKKMERTL